MGATKISIHKKPYHLENIAEAIGHPARLAIVLYLYRNKRGNALEFGNRRV